MYLVQIFRASPLMGFALLVCLATIFWCILLTRRQQSGLDKILTGLLGLIAIYEALRVLKDSGLFLFAHLGKLDGWADFIIAIMYLVAAMILKVSSIDRASTKVRLRLVEANEKPAEFPRGGCGVEAMNAMCDASPLATFAVDDNNVVTYWNAAAETLLGWKRDEIVGQRLPFPAGEHLRDKRGQEANAAVWTAPVLTTSGAPRGTLIVAADTGALREAGVMRRSEVPAETPSEALA